MIQPAALPQPDVDPASFQREDGPNCYSASMRYPDAHETAPPAPWLGMVIIIALIGWVALAAVVALLVRGAA